MDLLVSTTHDHARLELPREPVAPVIFATAFSWLLLSVLAVQLAPALLVAPLVALTGLIALALGFVVLPGSPLRNGAAVVLQVSHHWLLIDAPIGGWRRRRKVLLSEVLGVDQSRGWLCITTSDGLLRIPLHGRTSVTRARALAWLRKQVLRHGNPTLRGGGLTDRGIPEALEQLLRSGAPHASER